MVSLLEVLEEVMVSLLDLLVLGGSFGIGMQKHRKRSKNSGGLLAIESAASG